MAVVRGRLLETEIQTLINAAWRADNLCVSTISSWELKLLKRNHRIKFPDDVGRWRGELLALGVIEIPVDGSIGIRAASLQDFHADPADRMIVAADADEKGHGGQAGGLFFAEAALVFEGDPVHRAVGRFAGGGA